MATNTKKNSLLKQKQQNLVSISKLIFNTLLKQNRWYSGTSIKSWIRTNLFLPDIGIELNPNLKTNRWSAYCHFDFKVSFANLVEKCNPNSGASVLVNPLLDPALVQVLIDKKFQIHSLDVQKETLSFEVQEFTNYINKTPVDLVILPISNGLAKEDLQIADMCYNHQIKVLLVIMGSDLTADMYHLIGSAGATAVIYKTGPSWFPQIMNQITSSEMVIKDEDWYFSWFLEDRIISSTEAHLNQSQQILASFLEQTHFLLLQKIKQFRWTEFFVEQFALHSLYKKKLSSDKKNMAQIELGIWENWQNIKSYALPDVIFEVPQAQTMVDQAQFIRRIVSKWSQLQLNTKKLYHYFVNQVDIQPAGTMEVPLFYLDQTYLSYHFFSANIGFWQGYLAQNNLEFQIGFVIHPIFEAQISNLPNTALIYKYCIKIKVPERDLWLQ